MKDKEIEIYINGEKVDITDIYEPLKQGEYFYKENGRWYVHKLKNVSFVMGKDKKIEKIKGFNLCEDSIDDKDLGLELHYTGVSNTFNEVYFKINEIIDYINKEKE